MIPLRSVRLLVMLVGLVGIFCIARSDAHAEFMDELYVGHGYHPYGVAIDDRNVIWYTDPAANVIGSYVLGGRSSVEHKNSIPTAHSQPTFITWGQDAHLWFTERAGNKIGRFSEKDGFVEYAIPTASSAPLSIIPGPDANLWFTENASGKIGRITTSGQITEYALADAGSGPTDITSGADGALWFTQATGNRIGRISVTGEIVEYTLPTADAQPFGITAGPDGALWFTEKSANQIGRITTTGALSEYPLPTADSAPNFITASGGELWFTQENTNRVAHMTPGGPVLEVVIPSDGSKPTVITARLDGKIVFGAPERNNIGIFSLDDTPVYIEHFSTPTPGSYPLYLNAGPDGNMWAVSHSKHKILRLETSGKITEFDMPHPDSAFQALVAGPDGAMWYGDMLYNVLGRMTMDGKFTEYPVPTSKSEISIPVAGPDNTIWFPERGRIGRMTLAGKFTEFELPRGTYCHGLVLGPDGNIWFIDTMTGGVGYITNDGTRKVFKLGTVPVKLVRGPDKAIWFTENNSHSISRVTMGGVVTRFYTFKRNDGPGGLAWGPDGALWVALSGTNTIARLTPERDLIRFKMGIPDDYNKPTDVVVGSDGNIWFSQPMTSEFGKIPLPIGAGENSMDVAFGGWRGMRDVAASGGTFRINQSAKETVTYAFEGAAITWLSQTGPRGGQARVSIDGTALGIVDLYSPAPQYQVPFEFGGLTPGKHKITVQVMAIRNPASSGNTVVLDAFQVNGVTMQENDLAIQYNKWQSRPSKHALGGRYLFSAKAKQELHISFRGTTLYLVFGKGPKYGKVRILWDGRIKDGLDLYAPTESGQFIRKYTDIFDSEHIVTIQVFGAHAPASKGNGIAFDAYLPFPR